MKESAAKYAGRVGLKKFGSVASGTIDYVSLRYTVIGEQQAVHAAKLSMAPWASAWWRPDKSHMCCTSVHRGIPIQTARGQRGDFGLCGPAAEFLSHESHGG